jgi:hypothetical protein
MSMKKTDLEKNKMLKSMNSLKGTPIPDRFGRASATPDRKEQRKLDQAAGLIPFACKLPMTLVTTLNERAHDENVALNTLLANLLEAALETDTPKAKVVKAKAPKEKDAKK